MERIGFDITHVYGLTETYGPASVCAKQAEWPALPLQERARLNARQGIASPMQETMTVLDPVTMAPVPSDGETVGEIMFRGNITMSGYLKNPSATEEAFKGGWFHTGDLAVIEPDGYVRIKDRSKDVIISGGENIFLHRGGGRDPPPSGSGHGRGGGQAGREMGRGALRVH